MAPEPLGEMINTAILGGLIALTWWLPRKLGPLGLPAVHMLAVFYWFVMGAVALWSGIWDEYDGLMTVLGLAIQAFLFNCALLPLGIWAVLQWRKANAAESVIEV